MEPEKRKRCAFKKTRQMVGQAPIILKELKMKVWTSKSEFSSTHLSWHMDSKPQEHKEILHCSTEDSGTDARQEVWGFEDLTSFFHWYQYSLTRLIKRQKLLLRQPPLLNSVRQHEGCITLCVFKLVTQNSDLRYSWEWGGNSAHAPCREIEQQSHQPPAGFLCCSLPPLRLCGGDV